jgi:hypothetical protein
VGVVVDVVDGSGTIAGWTQVRTAGYYGFLHIYEDFPGTRLDEGAEVGEWLTIRVNGEPTGQRIQWTQFGASERLDLSVPASMEGAVVPLSTSLVQNYPNPFNPSTTIRYTLGSESDVCLTLYDIQGQVVRELVSQHQSAGRYEVSWDGCDAQGCKLASGVYLYTLRAGEFTATRKSLLTK